MAEINDGEDFPVESWMLVRVLPGDAPGAIRMRRWLKAGLRSYGIKCVRLTGEPPCDDSAANEAVARAKGIGTKNI